MENKKNLENNKKIKRKLYFYAAIFSGITIIALLIGFILFVNGDNNRGSYTVPNSYSFSGNILSTSEIYSNISLVIEEKNNSLFAIVLKNNELVSEKILASNTDYSDINDYSVVFSDYNKDGNKDFIYFYDKVDGNNIYKFYTIDKNLNINELDIDDKSINTKRASVELVKRENGYEYVTPNFYYDGYKIKAEIGEHEFIEKSDNKLKKVSKNSKISIEGRYDPFPRKVSILDEVPEYVQNVNSYLLKSENKKCMVVDLDGDKNGEYIVSFVKDGLMYISLFDSSANFLANLVEGRKESSINEVIEVLDIDNDSLMEIIVLKEKSLEVHKYNNGFYY